jgi:hypothetical protein
MRVSTARDRPDIDRGTERAIRAFEQAENDLKSALQLIDARQQVRHDLALQVATSVREAEQSIRSRDFDSSRSLLDTVELAATKGFIRESWQAAADAVSSKKPQAYTERATLEVVLEQTRRILQAVRRVRDDAASWVPDTR